MPQVVNNSPSNQGGNASGVGAVMFDSTVDPLQVHLQNLRGLDANIERRRRADQEKLALGYKLIGDLDPKVEGILDTDRDYFQQRGTDIQNSYKTMFASGMNPDNPAFADAYTKGNNLKRSLEVDAQTSKTQKETLFKVMQEMSTHPDKYDLDKSNKNLASFRASPFEQRRDFPLDKLLVPKKSDLLELTKTKVLKDEPLDVTSKTIKDPVSGGFTVETIKTYTPQRIQGLANAGYNGSPDVTESVNTKYQQQVDVNKDLAYKEQALEESKKLGRTVAPQELFYRDFLSANNPNQRTQSGNSYSPWQWQAAKDEGDDDYVKYIAETIGKANSDDVDFWGEENVREASQDATVTDDNGKVTTTMTGQWTAPPIQFSNALNNLPLGTSPIPVYQRDDDGAIIKDPQGKSVIKNYETIPNRVLGLKRQDGKVFIQTDESMVGKMQGNGDGWEPVNDRTVDKLVLGAKNPIKAAATLRKTLIGMNAYPNKNVKLGTDKTPAKTITTKEEFDALPKGATFIRNGVQYTKE